MDESFREVLKNFVLPHQGPEVILEAVALVLALVALVMLILWLRRLVLRRQARRYLLASAAKHRLRPEEIRLLLAMMRRGSPVHPALVFGSVRGFNRFFGPLIHELTDRIRTSPEAHAQIHLIFGLRKKLFGDVDYHFGNIAATIQLKPGQRLMLEFNCEGHGRIYLPSVVLDSDSEAIAVLNPCLGQQGFRILRGQLFNVSFYREQDGYYRFQTHPVQDLEHPEDPVLLLAHADRLESLQPREYYHATYRVPVRYRVYAWDPQLTLRYRHERALSLGEQEGTVVAVGRGELVLSTAEQLHQNDLLFFTLKLSPDGPAEELAGKVVRWEEQTDGGANRAFLKLIPAHPGAEGPAPV